MALSALRNAAVLALASSAGCILLFDEVVDAPPTSASSSSSGPVGGGGSAGSGASGGAGGTGGAAPCQPPPEGGVILQEPTNATNAYRLATGPSRLFVVVKCGSETCVDRYQMADLMPSGSIALGIMPSPVGVGLIAVSDDVAFYAPQGMVPMHHCNFNGGGCPASSILSLLGPWNGMAYDGGDAFVVVRAQGAALHSVTIANPSAQPFVGAPSSLSGTGHDVDIVGDSSGSYTVAWTALVGFGTGDPGGVARATDTTAPEVLDDVGAASGVALDEDGTVYFRAPGQLTDADQRLLVWRPGEDVSNDFGDAVLTNGVGLVAVHRATDLVYANGFSPGFKTLRTIYRCRCGACVTVPGIDCSILGGLDVDQASGAAFFSCDDRIVKWSPP